MPVHKKAACGHKRTWVKQKLNSFVSLWLSSSCLALPQNCSGHEAPIEWCSSIPPGETDLRFKETICLFTGAWPLQHQNSRILCLTGGSCDVWYKQKESKPSYPARKSWGPLSLGIMTLSFLVWVKWHSFSCGRKYILPLEDSEADCRFRIVAVCWERKRQNVSGFPQSG